LKEQNGEMDVIRVGIKMLDKELHSKRQDPSLEITDDEIVIDFNKEYPEKENSEIKINEFDITIDVKDEPPAKQY
jgi:hypothetical protein